MRMPTAAAETRSYAAKRGIHGSTDISQWLGRAHRTGEPPRRLYISRALRSENRAVSIIICFPNFIYTLSRMAL